MQDLLSNCSNDAWPPRFQTASGHNDVSSGGTAGVSRLNIFLTSNEGHKQDEVSEYEEHRERLPETNKISDNFSGLQANRGLGNLQQLNLTEE